MSCNLSNLTFYKGYKSITINLCDMLIIVNFYKNYNDSNFGLFGSILVNFDFLLQQFCNKILGQIFYKGQGLFLFKYDDFNFNLKFIFPFSILIGAFKISFSNSKKPKRIPPNSIKNKSIEPNISQKLGK